MDLWEIVNSSLVITIMSLIFGSILASWLAALWQRRARQYDIKLQQAEKLLLTYHEYIRILKGDVDKLRGDDFDRLHSQLFAQTKVASLVFKNKKVSENWKAVVEELAIIRGLRLPQKLQDGSEKEGKKPRNPEVKSRFDNVYKMARIATEKMFSELLKG